MIKNKLLSVSLNMITSSSGYYQRLQCFWVSDWDLQIFSPACAFSEGLQLPSCPLRSSCGRLLTHRCQNGMHFPHSAIMMQNIERTVWWCEDPDVSAAQAGPLRCCISIVHHHVGSQADVTAHSSSCWHELAAADMSLQLLFWRDTGITHFNTMPWKLDI